MLSERTGPSPRGTSRDIAARSKDATDYAVLTSGPPRGSLDVR